MIKIKSSFIRPASIIHTQSCSAICRWTQHTEHNTDKGTDHTEKWAAIYWKAPVEQMLEGSKVPACSGALRQRDRERRLTNDRESLWSSSGSLTQTKRFTTDAAQVQRTVCQTVTMHIRVLMSTPVRAAVTFEMWQWGCWSEAGGRGQQREGAVRTPYMGTPSSLPRYWLRALCSCLSTRWPSSLRRPDTDYFGIPENIPQRLASLPNR